MITGISLYSPNPTMVKAKAIFFIVLNLLSTIVAPLVMLITLLFTKSDDWHLKTASRCFLFLMVSTVLAASIYMQIIILNSLIYFARTGDKKKG